MHARFATTVSTVSSVSDNGPPSRSPLHQRVTSMTTALGRAMPDRVNPRHWRTMLTVLTQKTSPFDSFTLSDRRDNRRAAIDQPRRGANGGLLDAARLP
jgi:hypothetical protein